MKKLCKVIVIILGIALLILCIGYFYGSRHFIVRSTELSFTDLPDRYDGLRIVQFSDFHAGAFHLGHESDVREIVDLINSQHPDVIVFTGDIVTQSSHELDGFEDALSSLSAPYGVYSVMGNHDYALYNHGWSERKKAEDVALLQSKEKMMGWHLLLNDNAEIDEGLYIIGVENQGMALRFPKKADMKRAMKNVPEDAFKILLSHDPTHWHNGVTDSTNIQLTLSGHTHSGQFRLFGWSPVSWVYDEWNGVYRDSAQVLHVSSGVGCVPVPMRIGAWPEINVIILRKKVLNFK